MRFGCAGLPCLKVIIYGGFLAQNCLNFTGADNAIQGNQNGALDYIFQLADVSWPIVTLQSFHDPCSKYSMAAVFMVGREKKVPCKYAHVACPFPQRRQVNGENVEAIEQVEAKAPLVDRILQIFVCGGNDAHVHWDIFDASNPLDNLSFQYS